MKKTYPRAVVWREFLEDGEWSSYWAVYLDYGRRMEEFFFGRYDSHGEAMNEANNAVKKARRSSGPRRRGR